MRNYLFALSLILIALSCSNKKLTVEKQQSALKNYLTKFDSKIGEMRVTASYWVEAYQDSVTKFYKILLTEQSDSMRIIDTLSIGILNKDEFLDYGTVELNEVIDPELIVVYKVKEEPTKKGEIKIYEYSDFILKAWRANIIAHKIMPDSTKNVRVKQVI